MFVAELSALNLGSVIEINGVPMGSKYPIRFIGVLTEVAHNRANGYTGVRVSRLGWSELNGPADLLLARARQCVEDKAYRAYFKQFKYAEEVTIVKQLDV